MVTFTGNVAGMDGVEGLYRVVLSGNAGSGRQWQALVPGVTWAQLDVGRTVMLAGVLHLHNVDGDYFATLHVVRSPTVSG